MKRSLPMPVVAGIIAIVLLLAVVFLMKSTAHSGGDWDKDKITKMQEDAYKGNQGRTQPTNIPQKH